MELAGSKLKATAKVGTDAASLQLLRTPEAACLATHPSQRELTWPITVGASSYLISLTLFTGRGLARLAVNGFLLLEKSLGMFAQVESHSTINGVGQGNTQSMRWGIARLAVMGCMLVERSLGMFAQVTPQYLGWG